MNELIKAIALGVIRNAATSAGAWLVSNGILDNAGAQSFLGSVLFLAGMGFTIWDKFIVHHKIAEALATPAPLPQAINRSN